MKEKKKRGGGGQLRQKIYKSKRGERDTIPKDAQDSQGALEKKCTSQKKKKRENNKGMGG